MKHKTVLLTYDYICVLLKQCEQSSKPMQVIKTDIKFVLAQLAKEDTSENHCTVEYLRLASRARSWKNLKHYLEVAYTYFKPTYFEHMKKRQEIRDNGQKSILEMILVNAKGTSFEEKINDAISKSVEDSAKAKINTILYELKIDLAFLFYKMREERDAIRDNIDLKRPILQ